MPTCLLMRMPKHWLAMWCAHLPVKTSPAKQAHACARPALDTLVVGLQVMRSLTPFSAPVHACIANTTKVKLVRQGGARLRLRMRMLRFGRASQQAGCRDWPVRTGCLAVAARSRVLRMQEILFSDKP